MVFSIRHEILNVSWIATTFHGIRPPFVTQDCMQWHRKCSFFHSAHCSSSNPICFLICVVSTHNDSKKDLHRLCQSPRNCQCKRLLASSSAPETLFLFCAGWTVTTQLPSLVPPRHIDDCSAIHFLHSELCDLQLRSGHDCVSRGFTRQPESPNAHISGPRRFKHHQNSTEGPQRYRRKKENCGGRGKKARNFGPPTLRGPTLLGPTLWGHPSGPQLFLGLGPHPSRPHPSFPTLRGSTLRPPPSSGQT